MATTVVFSGGPFDGDVVGRVLDGLEDVSLVVAADSGLHLAQAVGLQVDVVIGDMDSVELDALAAALRHGAEEDRHPSDKDATDLELALDLVRDRLDASHGTGRAERDRVLVIGSDSGRIDHLLGWVGVIGSPRYSDLDIEAVLGETRVVPVHDTRLIARAPGSLVTLLALHGRVEGVRTSGLRWELDGASLHSGSSLGVSNEVVASPAEIAVDSGVLTVVLPPQHEGLT